MGLFGFGDNTKSQLKKLEKIAAKIEALDNEMQNLTIFISNFLVKSKYSIYYHTKFHRR